MFLARRRLSSNLVNPRLNIQYSDLISNLEYKIIIVAELFLIINAKQLEVLGFYRIVYHFSSYYHYKYQML